MQVNRAELSDVFGVAKTTVDAWRKRGCPVVSGGGKGVAVVFETVDVFRWHMKDKPQQEHSKDYARLLEEERYRQLKRANDIEEKLVAPVDLLTEAIEQASNQIIPILDSLPLVMKRHWPEITGDQITMVKKAIAECRNVIAESEIDI